MLTIRDVFFSCSFGACLDPSEKGAYPEPVANLECIRGTFIYDMIDEVDFTAYVYQVRVPCPNGMCANVITNCNSHEVRSASYEKI